MIRVSLECSSDVTAFEFSPSNLASGAAVIAALQ